MKDYTRTPNQIIDAIPSMSEAELKLTMVIVRLTFGYHREEVRMTYDDMSQATGLSKPAISDAIDRIEKRGFFVRGRRSMWLVNSKKFLLNYSDESKESLPNGAENSKNSLPYDSKNSLPSSIKEKKEEKEIPPTPKRKRRKKPEMPPVPENLMTDAFAVAWSDYVIHRQEIKKPLTPLAAKKQLNQLEAWGVDRAIKAINHSIAKGWQSIYEPKEYQNGRNGQPSRPQPAPAHERVGGAY